MAFDHPWLLLLSIPAIAVAVWLRRRPVLRSLAALAVVAAAAAPRFGHPGAPPRCRIYVLDASASVGGPREALTLAKADARDLGEKDEAGAVWVAERAQVELAPGPAARLFALGVSRSLPPDEGTKLGEGIDSAAALVPDGRRGEIVIISDGREIPAGSSGAVTAASARRHGIAVRTVPCGSSRRADARVDRVEAPGRVRAGEKFEATVTVSSSFPTRARISIGADSRDVALEAGAPVRVVFPQPAATKGLSWVVARVEPLDFKDVAPANNVNETPVFLDGALPVLVLAPEPGRPAEKALAADKRFSPEWASRPADLALYAAVVIDGLPADALGEAALARIADYVSNGGGLLLLGGSAGFGAGGYGDTPLDLASPVKSSPEENFTLAVLLDASGSMNEDASPGRTKLAEARDALRNLVGAARANTSFAFVAFNADARWIHPPTTDRASLLHALEKLDAGGSTQIAPALDKAREAVGGSGKRHVVLVSDGQSGEDAATLVAKAEGLRAAGATVSAIAAGEDRNMPLLEKLAPGRVYVMDNFSDLARLLREDLAKEQGLTAKGAFASDGKPDVLQLNVVKIKDEAEPLLLAGGRPLAAFRRFGRGRSVAFASALDAEWVADPARWGAEIPGLVSRVARPDPGGSLSLSVDGDDLVATFTPTVTSDEPSVEAELTLPDDTTRELILLRTGLVRFEARLRAPETGRFSLAAGPTRAAASRPWPAEYAAAGARPDLLALLEGPASGPPPALPPPRALAPWLLLAAVALVLLEAYLESRPPRQAASGIAEKAATLA
ncbi:MAG: VWA domain-containing protein [Planctomycetes bacterium]|nr:VWA domain-containing protein [Planctomycetota bacterium]